MKIEPNTVLLVPGKVTKVKITKRPPPTTGIIIDFECGFSSNPMENSLVIKESCALTFWTLAEVEELVKALKLSTALMKGTNLKERFQSLEGRLIAKDNEAFLARLKGKGKL